jgi:hypothetical protein
MERFNLKELSNAEGKEQYHLELPVLMRILTCFHFSICPLMTLQYILGSIFGM